MGAAKGRRQAEEVRELIAQSSCSKTSWMSRPSSMLAAQFISYRSQIGSERQWGTGDAPWLRTIENVGTRLNIEFNMKQYSRRSAKSTGATTQTRAATNRSQTLSNGDKERGSGVDLVAQIAAIMRIDIAQNFKSEQTQKHS